MGRRSTARPTGGSCSGTSEAIVTARLAHVGDRTGLEMIRALQHRAVSIGIDVFMECKIVRLLRENSARGREPEPWMTWRESGRFVTFGAKAVVLATGGLGKAWKFTTNSWVKILIVGMATSHKTSWPGLPRSASGFAVETSLSIVIVSACFQRGRLLWSPK